MLTSASGVRQIELREGKKNKAYRDSRGILTIGVGHTAAAGGLVPLPNMVISDDQIEAILALDLRKFEKAINTHVSVPLTQNQFDATVSFVFNIGVPGFVGSTFLRRLNQGLYVEAADAMLMWEKPAVLKARREGERAQFLTHTAASPAPTPRQVNPKEVIAAKAQSKPLPGQIVINISRKPATPLVPPIPPSVAVSFLSKLAHFFRSGKWE